MQSFAEALNAYTRDHPFDTGNVDAETVLDQLYQAYAESHESDPQEISEGFKELECFLETTTGMVLSAQKGLILEYLRQILQESVTS